MPVFFFMSTTLTATPVAPSLASGLEFGRANWTAADHAAARSSCRFVAGGRAYDLRALAGLTVVAELALGMESVGDKLQDELKTQASGPTAGARRPPAAAHRTSSSQLHRTFGVGVSSLVQNLVTVSGQLRVGLCAPAAQPSPASRAVPSPACDLAMSAAHEFDGDASERTLEGVARKMSPRRYAEFLRQERQSRAAALLGVKMSVNEESKYAAIVRAMGQGARLTDLNERGMACSVAAVGPFFEARPPRVAPLEVFDGESGGGSSGGGGSGKGGGGVEFEFASPTDLGDSKYSKSSPAHEKCASDPDDRAAVRLRLECDEKATAPILAAGALPFDLVAPCTTTVVVRAAAACGRRTRGALCAPGCEQAWVGDGACDRACLTAECRHDGHDCDGVLWEGAQPRFNVTTARHRGRHRGDR